MILHNNISNIQKKKPPKKMSAKTFFLQYWCVSMQYL
jgi:hypothetical protein